MSTNRRRRRLAGLGAAASASAPALVQQYCTGNCGSAAFISFLEQALSSGQLPAVTPATGGNCAGVPASSAAAKVTQIASGAAGVGVAAAAATGAIAGSVVPLVGTAIGAVAGILVGVFTHHAQAVQMQTNVLCENVPAANQAIQAFAAEGASATQWQQLAAQFQAAMQSDPSYKSGDALWGYAQAMNMLCAAYAQQASSGGAASAGAVGTAGSGSSLFVLAALALAAWFLL